MKKINLLLIALLFVVTFVSCQGAKDHPLQLELQHYVDSCPAKIGVAVILPDQDTILVNNDRYPMNSVVKLFQDLPSAQALIDRGVDMNDTIWIRTSDLNPDVYSPMMEEITELYTPFTWLSLFDYAVSKSDNNASDILFFFTAPKERVVEFWNEKGIEDFDIQWYSSQINQDPQRSQDNWTTPLAAARVISHTAHMAMISSNYSLATAGGILLNCATGENRISKPLTPTQARVWHKTGTGFDDTEGNPTSLSDVAYVLLPSGQVYTLAVFIKDSHVPMAEAEDMIARISEMVLQYICEQIDLEQKDK